MRGAAGAQACTDRLVRYSCRVLWVVVAVAALAVLVLVALGLDRVASESGYDEGYEHGYHDGWQDCRERAA